MGRPKGWYANLEGEQLVSMAQNMPGDLVVELGTAWGLSASYILWGTDARMVCIDTWLDDDVWKDFQALVAENDWQDRVTAIRDISWDAAREWTEPIGLLHIDASHVYEDVAADYRAWSPYVTPGGWIAFHDSQTTGVGQFLRKEVWPDQQWVNRCITIDQWSAQRDG